MWDIAAPSTIWCASRLRAGERTPTWYEAIRERDQPQMALP